MTLVLQQAGLRSELDAELQARVAGAWRFGLYVGPVAVTPDTVYADLTLCTVGGYTGEQPMLTWSLSQWVPPRAIAQGQIVQWTADGTTAPQLVLGYYVIDGDGVFRYAVSNDDGAALWGAAGQIYRIFPRYTRRAE